jgi:hypothetical protein
MRRKTYLDRKGNEMKTQPTHTPTPWKFKDEEHGSISISGEDQFITDVGYWDLPEEPQRGWFTQEQAQANAAYIVRAVNAHDRLLTIAKILKDYFDNRVTVNGSLLIDDDKTFEESVNEAISIAEGSPR